MRQLFCAVAITGVIAASTASAAIIQTFTDRTAFLAAAGTLSSEDFNGVVGEPSFSGQDLTVGGLTLRNDNADNRGFIDQPPHQFPAFNIDDTAVASITVNSAAQADISFVGHITAFGADFAEMNNSNFGGSQFSVSGQTIAPPFQGGATVQFFGIISDMPFASLSIVGVGLGDGFSMDNVLYSVSQVPLPPAGLLLLAALGLLGAARRAGGQQA